MYRLTLGGLQILALISLVFGATGVLAYDATSLLVSLFVLSITCFTSNALLVKIFKAAPSVESSSITAFILFFLLMPATSVHDALLLMGAGAVAMTSKYLFAIRGRHLFNPAAFGAFFSALVFGNGAIWWIATLPLLPFVLVFSLLLVRKIRRMRLFIVGVMCAAVTITLTNIAQGFITSSPTDLFAFSKLVFVSWPILFFAGIMLTEPATTPPTAGKQMVYGAIAGILSGLPLHVGIVYGSPELALLAANVFSYLVGAKDRMRLTLKERITIAKDTYHFTFSLPRPLPFAAGQYLEWTLPHAKPDSRGTRRYFTIASAPSEKLLGLGVKITKTSSSFKKALLALSPGDSITVSQLSGDFILPPKHKEKLAFLAGGIGITPFRSMIAELRETHEPMNAVLLYAAATPEDFAYTDLFTKAKDLGLKTVYIAKDAPQTWNGHVGYLTVDMLKTQIPDYKERRFYISGPGAMVDTYKSLLLSLGISRKNIATDYFPGL